MLDVVQNSEFDSTFSPGWSHPWATRGHGFDSTARRDGFDSTAARPTTPSPAKFGEFNRLKKTPMLRARAFRF